MKMLKLTAAASTTGIVFFGAPSAAPAMQAQGVIDAPVGQNQCNCDPWDDYCKWLCKNH